MSEMQGKGRGVELSKLIAALRWELKKAEKDADGDDLRFKVEEIELEVGVTIEHDQTAKGGIKVLVFELGGEDTRKVAHLHKVKVKLTPRGDGVQRKTDDVLVTSADVVPRDGGDDELLGG